MTTSNPTSGSEHEPAPGEGAGRRSSFVDPVLEALGWLLVSAACRRADTQSVLRVWVVDCGTGELAYGAAMTGLEALATAAPHARLQVFATDADEAAIELARQGSYSRDRLCGLDQGKVARYFVEHQGAFRVRECVRKSCLFSWHDLLRDPAVPGFDALLCRSELRDSLPWVRETSFEVSPVPAGDHGWVLFRPARRDPMSPARAFDSHAEAGADARPRSHTPRRARFLSQIRERASQARLAADIGALERSNDALRRTNAELTKRNDQQAAVARLGLRALWGASPDALFQEALAVLDRTMGTPVGVILDYQAHEQILSLRHATASARGRERGPWPAMGSGHLSEALSTTFPVFTGAQRRDAEPLGAKGPRGSGVACSIRDDVTVYGVLAAYANEERSFTREDAHFVQSLANVLAGAAGRDRRRKRLYLEHGVMSVLAEASSISAITVRIAPALGEALDAQVVELWVPERADSTAPLELLSRQSLGQPSSSVDLGPSCDSTLARAAFETGWPLWQPASGGEPQAPMLLAFPLFVGSTPVGVVQCAGHSALHVDDELVRGLLRVGHAIGESMHRLRITEALHESEQRLRAQSAELESVYATLPAGLTLYDRSMRLLRMNQRMGELLSDLARTGSSAEHDQLMQCHEYMRRVLETGEVIRDVELASTTREGELRWLLWSFAPVMDSPEHVRAASAIVQDITDVKRAEASLREAARQKDEFLAMLGHELRNPLAAIRNATDLLALVSPATPQVERIRNVLERQTVQTAKLIDSLLDVSRIVQGKLRLELETIDVVRIARELVEDRAEQLGRQGVGFELDLPDRPVWVRADRVRIVQVLDNLLANAAKFTSRGGCIGVEIEEKEGHAFMTVWDTGAGIDDATLPHIFEPFRQASQTLDRSQGGLGLGLALVKGVIELHGGSIRVESGVGRGSRFQVELLGAVEPSAPASRPPAALPSLRVLVVEDNADAAEMLCQLLRMKGHTVDAARCGESGLSQARAFHPDVVLCDIGLPGEMDGYDVARAFRCDPCLREVGLVAITGYGSGTDRQRAAEAGFDSCHVKPLDFSSLERELSRIVRRPHGQGGIVPR